MVGRWTVAVVALVAVAGCASTGGVDPGVPTGSSGPAGAPVLVTGTVRDAAGAPVVAATLTRVLLGSSAPVTQEAAVTDLQGRWGWSLRPGRWEITATAPGLGPATGSLVVVTGQPATLDLVLPPP